MPSIVLSYMSGNQLFKVINNALNGSFNLEKPPLPSKISDYAPGSTGNSF